MNSNNQFDLQLLWDKTNYGLDFWHEVFPESVGKENKSKHFKTHHENTASTRLSNKTKSKVYCIFNHSSKEATSPIDYIKKENHCEFIEAVQFLFEKYGLEKASNPIFKPETTFKNTDLELEHWKVTYTKKTLGFETIFPFATAELLLEYDFFQVKSYEKVFYNQETNCNTLISVEATENFPIYAYKNTDFCKLYAPKGSKDDVRRLKHSFIGKKPDSYCFGWDRIFNKYKDLEQKINYLYDNLNETKNPKARKLILAEIHELQLESVIIATGGTDGINIASLGYDVIWFNSEAEIITQKMYNRLSRLFRNIYYCPDLDKTGVDQAVKMGLRYLKIKMIWLPEHLKAEHKKDVADWTRKYKNEKLDRVQEMFTDLLSQALEFKFWEKNDKGVYSIKGKRMMQFLNHNGFYTHKIVLTGADNTKKVEEKIFVRIQKNVVTQVFAYDVKEFVLQWLEQNFISIDVYDMVLRSVFFSERSQLMSLPTIEFSTKTGTKDSQVYFFQNTAIKVKPDGIEEIKYDVLNIKTWETNVLKRNFKKVDPFFRIFVNESGNYDIEIFNNNSNYLKVLINTSRVFWEKDEENGIDTNKFNITSKNLSDEENQLQKIQLINKIFCVGSLLHKFKEKSKNYLILGIDRAIGKSAKDNKGGSGKSVIIEATYNFLINKKVVEGRKANKPDFEKFMLDGVTKETDLLYFDDLSSYYNINDTFNYITSDVTANHKGGKMFDISFFDFPKVAITMNAVPFDITDSLLRRLCVFECCNYYHGIGESFNELRSPKTDFKKDLFGENYTASEWLQDDNFMMQCLQFYLSVDEKIELQQSNLMVRNVIQQIGEPAMKFFNNFFEENSILDYGHFEHNKLWVHKRKIYDFYKEELGQKAKSTQDFKDILVLYCAKYKDWSIEFKKKKIDGTGNSVEHFCIDDNSNPNTAQENKIESELQPQLFDGNLQNPDHTEPETDLPF